MQLNRTIIDSPIMLFVGAGASASLDKPTMVQFVERLTNAISNQSQQTLLNILTRARGANLEDLLAELDTLISLDYIASMGSAVLTQYTRIERETAQRLRINVEHAIIQQYRHVDAGATTRLYKPLMDLLFAFLDSKSQCLPVFTTNYDPAIEVFCEENHSEFAIHDGFSFDEASRQFYWDRSGFDHFKNTPGKKNIVLFKMHGSADWLYVKARQKIRRGQAMYDGIDSDAYDNIIIYPATRKIATADPYYTAYEYFQRCCEHATVNLTIGYSFKDYDALTRLRGASSANDKLRLAILSPDAKDIASTLPISQVVKSFPYFFVQQDGEQKYLRDISSYIGGLLNQAPRC